MKNVLFFLVFSLCFANCKEPQSNKKTYVENGVTYTSEVLAEARKDSLSEPITDKESGLIYQIDLRAQSSESQLKTVVMQKGHIKKGKINEFIDILVNSHKDGFDAPFTKEWYRKGYLESNGYEPYFDLVLGQLKYDVLLYGKNSQNHNPKEIAHLLEE